MPEPTPAVWLKSDLDFQLLTEPWVDLECKFSLCSFQKFREIRLA